jgi:tetratricopeptide (TPR) repeat protein
MKNVPHLRRLAGALVLLAAAGTGATANVNPKAGTEALSTDAKALLTRAREARERGDLRVATLLLKNAAQAAPGNGAIQGELGTVLVMQGQMAQAERILREARRLGASDADILPALFQAMLSTRQNQAVLDQFPEPAASDPNAADILRARALALFALKKPEEASAAIDKALALRRTAPLLVNKAEFAIAAGDRAAAEAFTNEALKLSPRDNTALIMKIGLLERAGAHADALAFADRLVQAAPGQPLPLVLRIELLAQLQRDRDAEADVDRLLAIAPKLPIGLYDRALLLARKGDVKGAWQIAQGLPPEFVHSNPQFGLGFARMAQAAGNPELSIAALTAVVSAYPDHQEARQELARRRLAQKNFSAALEILQPVQASSDPRTLLLLGQAYQGLGQSGRAEEYFSRANNAAPARLDQLIQLAKANPGKEEVIGTLVVALIGQGRIADASAAIDGFEKAAPANAMTGYYRALVAVARNDFDQAARGFSNFLEKRPDFVPALFYRAQVAAARGDLNGARADLDRILRTDPRNVQALTKKAQYALDSGNDKEAVALLQRAAALQGEALEPRLALGQIYLTRKNFAQARALAEMAVKRFPDDVRAVTLLTRAYIGAGALDRARTAAESFARKRPASASAQILLSSILEQSKDQAGALAGYTRAARAEPANPAGYQALVAYHLRNRQKEQAVAAARQRVDAAPGPAADLFLADILARTGDKAGAQAVLEKSFARHPNGRTLLALATMDADRTRSKKRLSDWLARNERDVGVRSQLATMLMADGDLSGAKSQLEKALDYQPYNASLLNDLAWVLQESDGARALKLAAQAAKLSPRSGEILDTLAWLQWQQGKRKEGLELLRRAHQLSPDNASIAYHLAIALDKSGDRVGARKILEIALRPGADLSNRDQAQKLRVQWQTKGA